MRDFGLTLLQLCSLLLQFPQLRISVHVFAILTQVFSIKIQPFNGEVFPSKVPKCCWRDIFFPSENKCDFEKNILILGCQKVPTLIENLYHL